MNRRLLQTRARRACGGALVALCGAVATLGQPSEPSATTSRGIRLAADEQTLWLAAVGPNRTAVYRRGVNEPFAECDALRAPIADLTSAGGTLYVFAEDGSFYSLAENQWSRERDLPRRTRPLVLAGADGAPYALIRAAVANELPRYTVDSQPAASQPFDSGGIDLAIARYDSRGWAAAACPQLPENVVAEPTRSARLLATRGGLLLAWLSGDGRRIEWAELDVLTGAWRPGEPAAAPQPPRDYWLTAVNRVPALVLAMNGRSADEIDVRRLLGNSEPAPAEWRPAPLQLSDLPDGVAARHYDNALGFNQHVVLLLSGQDSRRYLRFGRIDGPPAESSIAVGDVLGRRSGTAAEVQWLPIAMLLVLLGIMLALFIFRRGALATAAKLPEGCAPALALQRLLACLVDLTPFLAATGAVLRVDWQGGAHELLQWGTGWPMSGLGTGGPLPGTAVLIWWTLACAAHTGYTLVMELLTHRTVGKVLTGTRVMSETGQPPTAPQIVVRNVLRFAELLPPLWVLGFLIVLSRNRQRAGDIFARTLVVRRAKPPESP